ncbi:hypothetical protein LS71_005640 [Helicobacter jaachi]|uniref:Uncharacterized protein n=1 Tax=Helicobacter jaachi TaxID=1677920 RepID=A0A4U8TA54_9HELI|nr:hypothetical protein [Helicobacter jaachi]TLD96544.1 hypothetical protein LS71_005640 [Helicobacter jaachi]
MECPYCKHTLTQSEVVSLLRSLDKAKKDCVVCHKPFVGSKSAKTCSSACRSKAYRLRKSTRAS